MLDVSLCMCAVSINDLWSFVTNCQFIERTVYTATSFNSSTGESVGVFK